MNTVSFQNANSNLENLIFQALNDHEEIRITTSSGSVVMIDESEWESLQELSRLFKDKKSLNQLLEGHNQRDNDLLVKAKSPEEVFNDLQN
jgi:PHD/YefM family antitoxin component YafN of YafNO toxin-antitoxin module